MAIENMLIDGLKRNYSTMSSMGSTTSQTNNESEVFGYKNPYEAYPDPSLNARLFLGDDWRKHFRSPPLPTPAMGQRSAHHANAIMELFGSGVFQSGDSSSDNVGLSTPASTTKSTPGESMDGDELDISVDVKEQDEKYDSDPHGIYNASPPPLRRRSEEKNLTHDPDETEEYISTPSRNSDESEGANSIEEGSVSRGRPSKKTKTKKRNKTGSTRRKKRSSSRR